MRIYHGVSGSAYIAGANDGIVTIEGKPAARGIYLINASTMLIDQVMTSLSNGHYIFMGLEPSEEYLVLVRDYKRGFEPFAWDCVKPAEDLTFDQQQALWQSWQT